MTNKKDSRPAVLKVFMVPSYIWKLSTVFHTLSHFGEEKKLFLLLYKKERSWELVLLATLTLALQIKKRNWNWFVHVVTHQRPA